MSLVRKALLDFGPLIRHPHFRYVFVGQTISTFGSMLTLVALPYQIWELTHSTFWVGAVSLVRLAALILFGFWGGVIADRVDRQRLIIFSELALAVVSCGLLLNSWSSHPSVSLIFVLAFLLSAIDGFHRPGLDSLIPRLVPKQDLVAVSALGSVRWGIAAVGGPALGGVLIAHFGPIATYGIDAMTFVICILYVARLKLTPEQKRAAERENLDQSIWSALTEGLRYAKSRQELLGTYVVDIVANVFAMPVAVFPALAERWVHGGLDAPTINGYLYSAIPLGSLIVSLFSGWTSRVKSHGRAIVIAAALWGVSIWAMAFAPSLPWALALLALSGAFDMVSAVFRNTIWNETIPSHLRGRLASVEMVSYMSGPLLGNARSGAAASWMGTGLAISSGGALCVVGVILCAILFPKFWRYQST